MESGSGVESIFVVSTLDWDRTDRGFGYNRRGVLLQSLIQKQQQQQ